MLMTSASVSSRPSRSAACFLIDAQVAMPPARGAGRRRRAACRWRPAGRRCCSRTRAGTPGARGARCRSGDWSTHGESVLWCRGCRRPCPRMPSGPGWFLPGSSTMKPGGGNVVAVAGDVVRPGDQRIVGLERHEDRAAALDRLVDAVVEELAEQREQRVVRRREADVGGDVGDEERLVRRRAPAGTPATGGSPAGQDRSCRGAAPGCPGSGPGTRRPRRRRGWSRSGRRSGC